MKRTSRREKIGFLLENDYYQRLSLYLYIISVIIVIVVYVILITTFGDSFENRIIVGFISLMIGIFMVFKKEALIKKMSEFIHESKRQNKKRESEVNLKRTIKRIVPKEKRIKLNIKDNASIKEKLKNLHKNIKKKKGKDVEDTYIEYNDK